MERLKLNDLINYTFLSNVQIAPDGNHVAFVGSKMDLDNNTYKSNIFVYNEERKELNQLTNGGKEKNFIWKDSSTIIFPGLREKEDQVKKENHNTLTNFYEISLNGGEAKKVFQVPAFVSSFKFVDDNNLILIGDYDLNKENFDKLSDEEKEESKDYSVFEELPYWSNGVGVTNKHRNRLYKYNLLSNKLIPLTDDYTDVLDFKLNHDKTELLLISKTYEDVGPLTMNLSLHNFKDDITKDLNKDTYRIYFADFLNDKVVFFGSTMESYGLNENPHIFITSKDSQDIKQITDKNYDSPFGSSVGSDSRYLASQLGKVDQDKLYFITTEAYNSNLKVIDSDGEIKTLTDNLGSIDGFDVVNGKIRFIGLRDLKLQELYSLDDSELQLSSFNDWLGKEKTLSKPEYISFDTDDVTIDGWLLKPIDFDKDKKYPTILNIHGGPKTVFGQVFFHEMQYWANEGYVVIFCNPRGSDGKGNAFADIRGKYGTIDYEDLMKFTDLCVANYKFIDGDKLGVTGGSYGGFMTNWIIGHTNRFKAAASQRSISNWFSFFGTTDIGYYFTQDQQAASPWDDPEKLWYHSPMRYANKVTTPTLFIHSDEDFRCWMPEALQMFTALKFHGIDSRVCLFKGENHELSRSGLPKHRVRRLKEITSWFDKYLK